MQVNPDIRKEKWTEDEDVQLIELVGVHGSCWAEISRGMAVRSSSSGWQCRQCWTIVMRPAPDAHVKQNYLASQATPPADPSRCRFV